MLLEYKTKDGSAVDFDYAALTPDGSAARLGRGFYNLRAEVWQDADKDFNKICVEVVLDKDVAEVVLLIEQAREGVHGKEMQAFWQNVERLPVWSGDMLLVIGEGA